jgi:DnaK suppressor protein
VSDSYNGLSESQMAALESELKRRQADLRKEVREERADSQTERDRRSDREVQDRGDEANTEQWREANAAMIGHHEDEIQGIQAALSRLTSGTYGLCVDCGEPIGFNRLQAWPLANRCLDCQSKAEAG